MAIDNHPQSRTANTLSGVLNELVQQVSDTSPLYADKTMNYKAVFKGPFAYLQTLNNLVGKPLQEAMGGLAKDVSQTFQFPPPPEDMVWVIVSTKVEQIEAGDHALLICDCEARWITELSPAGGGWTADKDKETWQVRWEAFTCDPYYFCKNQKHEDRIAPDNNVTETTCLSGHANREHVDMFLQAKRRGVIKNHRWYECDDGNDYYLNFAEELVTDKKIQETNALKHRPVLIHTTVEDRHFPDISGYINRQLQYRDMVGLSVDYIVPFNSQELSSCPYTFPDKYTWVKQGDDVTETNNPHTNTVSFQRVQTYFGVISADTNYYGHGAYVPSDICSLVSCRWYP